MSGYFDGRRLESVVEMLIFLIVHNRHLIFFFVVDRRQTDHLRVIDHRKKYHH